MGKWLLSGSFTLYKFTFICVVHIIKMCLLSKEVSIVDMVINLCRAILCNSNCDTTHGVNDPVGVHCALWFWSYKLDD